jgi:hypothetical protein
MAARWAKSSMPPALLDTMRPSATGALLRIASYTSTALPAPQAAPDGPGRTPAAASRAAIADAAPVASPCTIDAARRER